MDVNSTQVKELANFALSALEEVANSEKIQSIVRIEKATSQVCINKASSNRHFENNSFLYRLLVVVCTC
jgi:hypothetical protein